MLRTWPPTRLLATATCTNFPLLLASISTPDLKDSVTGCLRPSLPSSLLSFPSPSPPGLASASFLAALFPVPVLHSYLPPSSFFLSLLVFLSFER